MYSRREVQPESSPASTIRVARPARRWALWRIGRIPLPPLCRSWRGSPRPRAATGFLQAKLPAAAEGAVGVNQVEGDVATRQGQLVLLLHLRRLQVENGIEGDGARTELVAPDLQ